MATSAASVLNSQRPMTIAVTSGKGGTGKSQLIASMALELSRACQRTLLVDADIGCGNLDLLLDLDLKGDLREVLEGRCSAAEVVARARFGETELAMLPAPRATRDGAELSAGEQFAIIDAVESVGHGYDYVLIDTGAGVSRNPMLFASAADRVILVTTPEPLAVRDAYAAIKVLHQAHRVSRFDLVVNQCLNAAEGRRVYARLSAVIERFLPVQLRLLGALPTDERVSRAVRAKAPAAYVYPSSPWSQAVRALVGRLIDGPVEPLTGGQIRYFAGRLGRDG